MTTYTFPISLPEARELLESVVEEKGRDFVYKPVTDADGNDEGCLYWHEDGPSCGVGVVAYKAGVPVEDIKAADTGGGDSVLDSNPHLKKYFDPMAIQYLRTFQDAQDDGISWGEAFDRAEVECCN